ncbi:hypothetical protein H6G81_05085 [Scytonema hofmannii FACHB-248]|uniref:Uncharacterized protein n=3 Tax=Nostocales TaxID=1161 RepID=A0ABR8GL40_9CYAN|nr:hypothetical protein [Scytonema hofmannii FACHB-248]
MLFKKSILFILTTAAMLTTSSIAMADSLISNGGGGDYKYQLWRSTDNTQYYLKIWSRKSDPNSAPLYTTRSHPSSREALDYFDCNYAHKSLPSCPR